MDSMEVTFPELATIAGEKAQLIPTGRFEHENAMGVAILADVEMTVIEVLATFPRLIFSEAGAA